MYTWYIVKYVDVNKVSKVSIKEKLRMCSYAWASSLHQISFPLPKWNILNGTHSPYALEKYLPLPHEENGKRNLFDLLKSHHKYHLVQV